jgi:hypothetical protein
MPLPDQVAGELAVIDAALAGESVDPEFAELAELTLLLAAARTEVPGDVAERLDRRVSALASAPEPPRLPELRRSWIFRPAFGAGLALAAALVVVVIVLAGRGGGGGSENGALFSKHVSGVALPAATSATASSAAGVSSSVARTSGQSVKAAAAPAAVTADSLTTPTLARAVTHRSASSASVGSAAASTQSALGSAGSPQTLVPAPQTNGRRIVQSAQLTLSAPAARIATVAQELFSAVGAEAGIVKHSQVSSGSGGFASFTLSIPTQNLTATLTRLTQLHYAHVTSSTESSTDVNSQYLDDVRALKDAEALRTSLLKQLAAATTTVAIDSLKSQLADAETAIAGDERRVNGLQGRISFTSVSVQINAGAALPGPPPRSSHGFTISRAAHDALRVLTDVGGGALIALAVLAPLAILAGLAAWVTRGWRRRGRERALDAA